MDCPVCAVAMVTLELADVEIDYCLDCHGIWLDRGELEMLIRDVDKSQALLASFAPVESTKERPRPCPICRKVMAKVRAGAGGSAPLIDKCKRSHGLWFDKDELRDILTQARLDPDNRICDLLADMFGQHR